MLTELDSIKKILEAKHIDPFERINIAQGYIDGVKEIEKQKAIQRIIEYDKKK